MSKAVIKSIGRCKINVEATGCIECGTEHASGWSVARTMPVTVGGVHTEVPLPICDGCRKKKGKGKVE